MVCALSICRLTYLIIQLILLLDVISKIMQMLPSHINLVTGKMVPLKKMQTGNIELRSRLKSRTLIGDFTPPNHSSYTSSSVRSDFTVR